MEGFFTILLILFCHTLLISHFSSSSFPLCTNNQPPFTSKKSLSFCGYNKASVCCNSTEDSGLRNQLKAMNVNDSSCASLLKSILCSKCDPFSAEIFRIESTSRKLPVLCNSTASANSTDFCSKVWNECRNVSVSHSPFSTAPRLSDTWQSASGFCAAFGDSSSCFDGKPVSPKQPMMCVEKIGNGSYLNMAAHPDGSDRVFVSDQQGMIWLAQVPQEGSGEAMMVESDPFLDITDEVFMDSEFGLMGIAFHPGFERNGRFFASFNCDKAKWPQCSGRCACNSDVGCDPSLLASENGAHPCRYHAVVAEFTSNGSSVRPQEVRRIFTMGLPYTSHHAGQILFGPEDGYLYFMMGDGGGNGDPHNFAQNKKSLLGKIMRLDIDTMPSATGTSELDLWGNYSIPDDNPFSKDKESRPEIFASGFRNPWRCSFDLQRPSYFLCADVGQDEFEEVDMVRKGGNYGWRVYEGPFLHNKSGSDSSSMKPIFPVMGYNHSEVSTPERSASITGGYFYRSTTDPCLYGRYIYADLYGSAIWAGTESPTNSGSFTTTKLNVSCARDSPIQCGEKAESYVPSLGLIFSFGQDNRNDTFIMASNGLYRVVRPSRCGYVSAGENRTAPGSDNFTPPLSPSASPSSTPSSLVFRLSVFLFLWLLPLFSVP